ncbi:MAG: choline ABC transporter ATP-binding protein [Ectothiorhodospiraceae bacterium]|nr:choline ABC transporter ATP-binding protein [Chromatiales bacterium]MCP5157538.1 choline ABC transporter ATP-binding protein [Ectothiorhodospiraceae bacterium]
MSRPVVRFHDVDIVFGPRPELALPLIDAGRTRPEIQAETGQVLGVAGATLDVHEGEVVVLMGLSGSGKSTLLRAVNGLNRVIRGETLVDDGEALVDPQRCSASKLRELRMRRVAMVFQQFALLPWRTVAENVGFVLELAGVAAAERRRRVAEQLEMVGLASWGDHRVDQLSGGMQQRVGLARAFATRAPILLMDEPYSALDPLIRARLQDELLELQARFRCTIVFVSHDLDEALKIGNRIAIMEGGRIVQCGTPQEIVLRPANDYVADFVAHMNPLNVLRAREVMRAVAGGASGDHVALDADPQWTAPAARTVVAPLDAPLRSLIRARLASGRPVLVEEAGRVVGEVDDEAILSALLRR